MADPYKCLRCTTIGIGIYNIIYCLAQFGILGWQVQTVKVLQWEYENRQLPATGAIDGFQARFPGLYAIYTETPERRRINTMYAIVLICLGLSIVHLMTTISMLYGAIKRLSNWIVPWFFTCAPIIIMCTAYSVLWWSGDVFNEQLTMSVTEFVMSLAINGICFVVVILYFLRITGRLTSDRSAKPLINQSIKSFSNLKNNNKSYNNYLSENSQFFQKHQYLNKNRLLHSKNNNEKKKSCFKPDNVLPPWHEVMPSDPSYHLERKIKRRERDRSRSPISALRQGYNQNYNLQNKRQVSQSFQNASLGHRKNNINSGKLMHLDKNNIQKRSQSSIRAASYNNRGFTSLSLPFTRNSVKNTRIRSLSTPNYRNGIDTVVPSINEKMSVDTMYSNLQKNFPARTSSRSTLTQIKRKSPQRVSFTKTKPKVYEQTPESSLSDGQRGISAHNTIRLNSNSEIHTVV